MAKSKSTANKQSNVVKKDKDKVKASSRRKSLLKSFIAYINDTKAELAKVTWLPKNKLVIYVLVVIVIAVFISGYVAVADFVIAKLLKVVDAIIN